MGLEELAAAAAARLPADAIAVAGDSGSLTYAELDELANRVANALAGASVGVGDRVGLWLPRSPEAVAAMQGVLRLRACYVPVDPHAPVKRAAAILGDCGVRAVITSHERVAALTGEPLAARYLTWREVTTADGAPRERAPSRTDDLAFILYTSGSTGQPKGVCITHGNAHAFVAWSAAAVGARAGDRFSNHAPFHFDLSVFDLYASFLVGGSTHLVPDSAAYAPAALVDFIRAQRIDIWYSVPSALVLMESGGMLERDELPMRVVIFAGEPYPIKHLRRLRERFPRVRLFNFYGPTETNVCTAYEVGEIAEDLDRPVPIGVAASGDRVWAVKEDGTPATAGEVGELHVAGPTVMRGYWGQPPQGDRPYATGDIVRLLPSGDLDYVGRRDGMVKLRGHRVELGDIEATLLTFPGAEAAAVAVRGSGLEAKLVAFIVAPERERVPLLAVKKHCAERLPRYMIIDEVHRVESLPRNANGKLDRHMLATWL